MMMAPTALNVVRRTRIRKVQAARKTFSSLFFVTLPHHTAEMMTSLATREQRRRLPQRR